MNTAMTTLRTEPRWVKDDEGQWQDETLLVPGTEDSVYGPSYYKNRLEQLEDSHYDACPLLVAAKAGRFSTLCLCAQLEAAETAARAEVECQRCHTDGNHFKCGPKAQWV